MIVLVNQRQTQDLEEFSADADRFAHDVETGIEWAPAPVDALAVSGVPEPEEWALLIVVTILLATAYLRQHKNSLVTRYLLYCSRTNRTRPAALP